MGLLRSETMNYGLLILPPQDAKKLIEKIGFDENVHVQFEDMCEKDMKRPFRKYIQRIDEVERILRYLQERINENEEASAVMKTKCIDEFYEADSRYPEFLPDRRLPEFRGKDVSTAYSFDELEMTVKKAYSQFVEFRSNNEDLLEQKLRTDEEYEVVEVAAKLLQSDGEEALNVPLLGDMLTTIAGVVDEKVQEKLRRQLWRASRGMAYTTFEPCKVDFIDPKTNATYKKSVFAVYFQGGEERGAVSAMMAKVTRVCQAYGVNLYTWPKTSVEAIQRMNDLSTERQDKDQTLKAFENYTAQCLQTFTDENVHQGNSKIEDFKIFCRVEKSVYSIMNMLEEKHMTLRANIWYPAAEEQILKDSLAAVKCKNAAILLPDNMPQGVAPPTFCNVNDLTAPWQEVIDTYGIPSYKTANPAVITTVTFPFIFGMMYGDIGHGSLLCLAGLCLCLNPFGIFGKNMKNENPDLYNYRYVPVQLGFFAIFAGLMYNDLFGMISLELFESRFDATRISDDPKSATFNFHWPKPWFDRWNTGNETQFGPYPFGCDPAWHGSSNELLFSNSLKMKLSVLFGVLQMTMGVFLRFSNAVFDRNWVDFWCECVPMLMFMLTFFGYMNYMILYKWLHVIPGSDIDDNIHATHGLSDAHVGWGHMNGQNRVWSTDVLSNGTWTPDLNGGPPNGPPSIINSLISLAMGSAMGGSDAQPLYPGADHIDHMLMLCVVLSVPWLLIPKPFFMRAQHAARQKKTDTSAELESGGDHGHGHGEFEFGEVLIHQIIETIEYVLGTVSHTASYLRIWALSLAHQQLSLVFYTKTIINALSFGLDSWAGAAFLWFMFGAWFATTAFVLLAMDVLECFLHTLRLHWVEFQSKFYKNDGYKFDPYNIDQFVRFEDTAMPASR